MKYRNYNLINKINKIVRLKLIGQFLPFLLLMVCFDATAQYDVRHYIAPADWNYFTNANEVVVCTNSAATANITISRSDGTVITSALTATQGNPAVFRFAAAPNSSPVWAQSTILSAAGIIVTSNQPISVNIRNVMSDSGGLDAFIKGNASLFSFGSAGIGTNFRVGYYRNVGAAADLGYSIMAIENGTQVSLNGVNLVTLNAGESYIIPGATTAMGSLVTASKGSVMTVYKHLDSPGGCGDGTYDQIPPVSSLGFEYVVYRSSGTVTPEQNTVVATEVNTVVTNQIYNATTGAFISTSTTTLVNAGDFVTFSNGDGATAFSANRIVATKKVAVYAGQAQSCEVDITSVIPVSSPCNGSRLVETYKFRNYALGNLPYFGYVLIHDATSIVLVNGVNIETIAGVRRQLGTSGWYLIDFTNVQISSPNDILITCPVNISVSMVQQGGGFSMSSIFSNFVSQPEVPSVTYNSTGSCINYEAVLTAQSGYSNYQWYLNDVAISGATSQTYTTLIPGSYSYSALLPCGDNVVSPPISVNILPCSDVSVVKTVNNPTPNAGSNVTFTITATANGPHNATGVSVNDVLSAGYTFVSATPSTGTWTAPNWTIGNLANGTSATLTIVATVNGSGPYANTATISGTGTDLTPGNNTSTVTPVPVPQANLSVVKTVSNPTPNVGSNVTFTITAGNAGPSNATGVSVNDVLPAGYTFVSATPSVGTWTAPNWTIGTLANGASATLTIVATVNASGPYANTATITGVENDPTPADNTSTVTPVPVTQANLSVVKTVSNPTPNVGSNVTFTITAGNAGPSNATGVSVNDVLPAGYTFVSATPSVGTWTAPNWTIGTLANGASATLTVVATVNASGSYANTATITGVETDPTPGNNTSTVTPVPVAQANLSVVKTVSNPTPNVGSNVTFTITAGNAGPSNATGVSVNDVLPAGYTFVSATPSVGTWTAPNWTIGTLANGASATLTIVATVNGSGPYANTATITGVENDPTPADNTSTVTPVPVAQANLSVVKTVSNPTPNVGSNVTFTITAGNAGPSNATGVSVNDVLPAGYTFVSATPSVGTWTAPNWTIGTLANGASATLTIVATVNASGSYANTATITGVENDPTPGNNTSTVTPVPIIAQANLSVVKTVSNPTPNVGSNVTFTITTSNAGPSNATGVSVNDVLAAGYTFVSATPSTGTWTAPNWTIGALANGASATLTIVATVNGSGSYANTATITGVENDPTPGNNTSTVTPVPVAQANLSVVKTVSNPTPNVGSNVTFTITAANAGPSNATGVSVNDVLAAGYTFVSATPSTGTWTAPNWTIGTLANGASATLTIVATVNASGPYANTATITGAENDPTPGNNTSTVTPVPVAQANLSVVKTVSNPTPNVGGNVTFTITAGNAGPSNATGVSVNDVLAAGYTFVSATPSVGTWTAPNWTIGTLANGASATLTIVATVNASGPYANTATITGVENDPTPGNNTSTVTPVPVAQANLSVVKTVSNPTPNVGSNVTFTITAANAGPSNATGVSVNDVLAAGYTFVSATPSVGTWTAPNWTIGALANGASATLTIVATVNASGPYANTATITGVENDPTPGNNTSTVTPVPVAQANLSVVKTVSNPTPNVGSNVTFTITAANAGPSNATGVSVNDVLAAGYTFVSATPSTGTWTAPNWTIGTLANGASATLTIVATVNGSGPYANTATITGAEIDPTPGNNTSTVTPVPVAQTNLSVVKTVSNPTPNVGGNVTFTITTSNAGPSNATGVSVNDVLAAGYTFVSATPSTGTWTAPNWTIGTLANGASATLTIVATVNASGPYANTATITGAENDPTPANNTSTVTPVPVAQTNLSVVKTVSNPTPNVGSNVTFTITAANAGPSNATGVSVNDVLAAGYTFVSATPSTGTWTAPNWTIGTLANGASATLTIVATVNASGPYANTATITGAENDPTPANNTSTVTPVPVAQTNLSVVKTVSNPTPNVGSNVTFTITAANAGPSNATGVSVNDVLAAGYTFVSATPSTGTWTAPNWTIGTLANGASATLTIVATVNASGPYANTATITGAENDPTPANNTSTVTPVPVAQANLSVVKTVSNPTPNVGSNVTFTITAANAGPSNATGVSVNDVLAAGYTFVSATPSTGTWTAPNWTIGTLANGASATLTIVVTVNGSGPYANTATITGVENDPTPGNNTSTVTPVPVAQTNLSVVKTVSNPTPNLGSNVTFTITAANAGPSNATGVSVNDVLAAGYTFVSATPSTGIWTAPNWTIGTLANGASATLTIVATVNASGPYANTATITGVENDPTPANNTSTVTPVPVGQANLSVVKTVSNPTPNVGSNVTFTITAANAGPSNATGVSVNDVLAAGYTFVSATPSTGTWTAPNWTIGTLANGASATLTIVATVNASGPYANTATITGAEIDPTPANNTSTVTPVPVAQANLSVVKTVSNPTPNVGGNVTFTITAANAGPSNATGVSVNDVLAAGYTFVSATPSTGTWTAPNWTIGTLANGASATLTIVATVNGSGPYANTATITGAEIDPTPGNNTSTVTPVPVAQTNLSVVKTVSNPTPNVGSNVTFTITAANAGPSNATGVSVNDVLTAGYTFVSATPSVGTWTAPNWTIGTLANGASATLTIVATVNASGPYANTATITGVENDPTPGNNTSTVTPVPVAQANLSVVKTVSNPTPNVGSNVTFTITAANAGPSNATGVSVNDVLTAGYTFVSATPSVGTWTAPNWTIGTLANGASATLTIVATVNASGPYANTATITGVENDPTPGNNTSTVTPVPVAQANLSVVKTVSNPTPNVGSNVTFTITAANAGPSNATGVSVNDVLPAGYTFVSATPSVGAWTAPNWTIGTLANGASATLTIVATVNASGPYANTATITGVENDPTPANNTSTVTPVPVAQTNLSVVKTVSNPTPDVGSNVTFTITAANAGPSNATGVSVNDVLTAGYTFVSATPSTGTWTAPNWTIGTLANGVSATLTIVATVNTSGPYANTATITGVENDPTLADNTSTVTPVPVNIIDAVIDSAVTVISGSGITTVPGTVIGNDTLNGVLVTTTNTNVTPTTTGPLSVDANGVITVAPNTPSGTYVVTYQICEADSVTGLNVSPSNCDSTTATVIVVNVIDAVIDPAVTVSSGSGITTVPGTVIDNDTLNGVLVTTTNTNVTPITTGPLSIDANGVITVAPNTPSGTYVVTYQICEADSVTGLNVFPSNCDSTTATVIVANVIDAVIDPAVAVSSGSGITTVPGTVIGNDTLNGILVTTTNTNVTPITTGPLSIDANGVITVAANTPSGTYVVTYQICEADGVTGLNVSPSNCDSTMATVIVANVIDAEDDEEATTSGSAGSTGILTIFDNDTFNGSSIDLTEVTLTVITPDPTGHIILNGDGTVDVLPGTPAGTYTITYQICENGAVPANCDTATVTINVTTIEDIDIYTHLTPNGDGDNDVFFIDGIEKYPNNVVEIYNRWGVLVYEVSGYNNADRSFSGLSNGRVTVNRLENLPEGTYYYILRYTKPTGESKEKAAYLYINR